MVELAFPKKHDELRQGQPFEGKNALTLKPDKNFYIESYGCQMNFADSEVVASILLDNDFAATTNFKEADLIFINTCSIIPGSA